MGFLREVRHAVEERHKLFSRHEPSYPKSPPSGDPFLTVCRVASGPENVTKLRCTQLCYASSARLAAEEAGLGRILGGTDVVAKTGSDNTFPKLIVRNARVRPTRPAFRHKDLGIWQSWNWAEVHEAVRAYAVGLHALGLKRGNKIAIVGYNKPRLYWTMAAAQWLGAIPVPVYSDSVADEMAYVLAHAEVTHAVAQDQEQVDKLLSVADRVPTLTHILYDEPRGLRDYDHGQLHPVDDVID